MKSWEAKHPDIFEPDRKLYREAFKTINVTSSSRWFILIVIVMRLDELRRI